MSATTAADPTTETLKNQNRFTGVGRQIMMSPFWVVLGAVILAIIVGSLLIVATNKDVEAASGELFTRMGYFFADPGATFAQLGVVVQAMGEAAGLAYSKLFTGAIYNPSAPDFATGIAPLMKSLKEATPLILAGLGVGFAFRAGMFNIGGQGQIILSAIAAGYVATKVPMSGPAHLLLAVVAGVVAAALWAGIAGFLKAKTGAHEVIVTIMLNHIGKNLLLFALSVTWLLAAGSTPKTSAIPASATYGKIVDRYDVTWGFVVAVLATVVTWVLLERSSLGFRLRTVGENPAAARTAGINVNRMYLVGMLVAGALVGLAGTTLALGSSLPFGDGVDAGVGFAAITVALLGASRPFGVLAAGLLFGIFQAGSTTMKVAGIPPEIVQIVQALIVLFIAAPPLVRAVFGLPKPGKPTRSERRARKQAASDRASAALTTSALSTVSAASTATVEAPPTAEEVAVALDEPVDSIAVSDAEVALDADGVVAEPADTETTEADVTDAEVAVTDADAEVAVEDEPVAVEPTDLDGSTDAVEGTATELEEGEK